MSHREFNVKSTTSIQSYFTSPSANQEGYNVGSFIISAVPALCSLARDGTILLFLF